MTDEAAVACTQALMILAGMGGMVAICDGLLKAGPTNRVQNTVAFIGLVLTGSMALTGAFLLFVVNG